MSAKAIRSICGVIFWPVFWGIAVSGEKPASIRVSREGEGSFVGRDHRPLQAAIDAACRQGGGEILLAPGDYLIGQSLKLTNASNITLRGEAGAVLRLPPLPYGKVAEAAASGAGSVRVDRADRFQPQTRLHFVAPGKLNSFTGKPQPYVLAKVERIEPGRLVLQEPLEFPVPEGTMVYREGAPNIFALSGACENIAIEDLTLDGGRREGDPPISGHVIGCGVLAEGRYSYEEGPLGPPVSRLTVRRCVIRQCFGRGVALYSAADSVIEDCTIEDTVDEAIDFDHFAVRCRAENNLIARCGVGVELNDANECLVKGNRMDACHTGVHLWRWCRQPEWNVRNQVIGNRILNTRGSAVLIRAGTSSNTVAGNEITGCGGAGVMLDGENQTLVNNRISGAKKEPVTVQGRGHVVHSNTIAN